MRYIDTGGRSASDALGTWLQQEVSSKPIELRWQSGFFGVEGLGPLVPLLNQLRSSNGTVRGVIGSNDGDTLQADVLALASLVGIPRSYARLGVVSYSGAFYHPKTYHFRRADGSETAYVGSANLSASGVASLHVEAGLIVDTADGDPQQVLQSIRTAVDDWFSGNRSGFEEIRKQTDIAALTNAGVLRLAPAPRIITPSGGAGSGSGTPRPRLQPLITFPKVSPAGARATTTGTGGQTGASAAATAGARATPAPATALPSVPRSPPFPPYLLFAPGASAPTSAGTALTGASLPAGSIGLVVRLNRDSARHFAGRTGTANISVPVATLSTIRFGMYPGRYLRPRAEFVLEARYLSGTTDFRAAPAPSNIMAYGFDPAESGHGDVRMVVPVGPPREIRTYASANSLPVPQEGDVAVLEWPTSVRPSFRLTTFDSRDAAYLQLAALMAQATASNQLVGQGACWLAPGVAPIW